LLESEKYTSTSAVFSLMLCFQSFI